MSFGGSGRGSNSSSSNSSNSSSSSSNSNSSFLSLSQQTSAAGWSLANWRKRLQNFPLLKAFSSFCAEESFKMTYSISGAFPTSFATVDLDFGFLDFGFGDRDVINKGFQKQSLVWRARARRSKEHRASLCSSKMMMISKTVIIAWFQRESSSGFCVIWELAYNELLLLLLLLLPCFCALTKTRERLSRFAVWGSTIAPKSADIWKAANSQGTTKCVNLKALRSTLNWFTSISIPGSSYRKVLFSIQRKIWKLDWCCRQSRRRWWGPWRPRSENVE